MTTEVVVYGRENCHYCKEAKKLNEINAIQYVWKDVNDFDTKEELLDKVPNAKSIPQIFVNGKHIGGYDEYKVYVTENMVGLGKLK